MCWCSADILYLYSGNLSYVIRRSYCGLIQVRLIFLFDIGLNFMFLTEMYLLFISVYITLDYIILIIIKI
jgi:hypothetical protein